jgi:4-carboxymuconolactone decarboxylase
MSQRFEKGWQVLEQTHPKAAQAVLEQLSTIAPDFGRFLVEFGYGDIYARPGLDLKSREMITIAALTAMGNAAPQLKTHIEAGLNVGLTREQIVETIMQMAVYAGIPAALNALSEAKEAFAGRD